MKSCLNSASIGCGHESRSRSVILLSSHVLSAAAAAAAADIFVAYPEMMVDSADSSKTQDKFTSIHA